MATSNAVAENAANNDTQVNNNPDANQPQQAAAAPPRQSGWQIFQSVATRMLIMYFAMNAMSYFRGGAKTPATTSSPGKDAHSVSSSEIPGNLFPKGSKIVK